MATKPAPPPRLRIKLNLLYPQGIIEKLPIKFLKWLISYGRFIVIAVEVVVVAAFVFRFTLDARLDDLKRKINNEKPFIEGLSTDEALIRQTQLKLTTISSKYQELDKWSELLPKISRYVPSQIRFTSLALDKNGSPEISFKIIGKSKSNVDLSIFLNNLKKDPIFKNINLDTISFDQGEISFTISGSS